MKSVFLLFCFFISALQAQKFLVSVTDGSFVTISKNTSFFVEDLTITPSDTFIISDNLFRENNTELVQDVWNQCVDKTYTFSRSQKQFKGSIAFNYKHAELDSSDEGGMYIAMRDNSSSSWFFTSDSNLDFVENKILVNYTEDVILGQITLAYPNGPLIYPNPLLDVLNINFNAPSYKRLYNFNGVICFQTEDDTINLSDFSSGTYLLEIISKEKGQRWYKKIIKM
tara:strand:+ start:135 stop:812 length:678 start_codon:yes stop_codon:yes gene_type:complete